MTALAGDADALAALLTQAVDALQAGTNDRGGPLPAGGPEHVTATVRAMLGEVLPVTGAGAGAALADVGRLLAAGSADPADPACAGHLHCPPLAVAVAADTLVAAVNQSLDSWDQAPAAHAIEECVLGALHRLVGYDPTTAGGVLTSGGSESNLTALLLARDKLGAGRVFCSELAHFSVQRSAAFLGLGEDAVVPVPVDAEHRMRVDALDAAMRADEGRPLAVVATAGTTDLGSIDPLTEVAEVAHAHRVWAHVDAAYGGGALFSTRLAGLFTGLATADSITLDLHKLGWQPIPAGVFLARDRADFAPLARTVAYLNPRDDQDAGYPSRLGYSMRTTRRADAVKIAVTLRALGRDGIGALVDACHDLALYAAERVDAEPALELAAPPVLTSVVFSYRARTDHDRVNAALRRRLLATGRAVIGRTELAGRTRCKLTLLNPHTTRADVDRLLAGVVAAGAAEDR